MDLALLILRMTVGVLVAGHGAQKLFGWFGGHGLAGTGGWLESIGFRPGRPWAMFAGLGEFGGGVLLALGLFSPLGSVGVTSVMLMAIVKTHWPKVWAAKGGMELPLTNLGVAVSVAIAGPGAYSLDAMFGTSLSATLAIVAAIVVLAGWIFGLITSSTATRQVPSESAKRGA